MKKLLLAGLILTGMSAVAQTPRLSLYEEFTGETCPPCAATNPGLNALLASPTNTPKIIAIKWQVPIPSAPTATWSLYQTNKTEINWRAGTYYTNINSAPTSKIDGQDATVFGQAPTNHPGYLNNTVISTAQSNMSPFSVTMARAWDATYSAVDLTITITASMNYTATGNLVFRTVMVEREIHFPVQPGTNGEKDFEDVGIKSFPTLQGGTAMAGTWTTGQTQTIVLNCPIPSYARDKAQIAFVGFIQDDGNSKVEQAVRAEREALPNDARAVYVKINEFDCAANFAPEVSFKNQGNNTITGMDITPYVDGVAQPVYNWTGSLAVGASNTVTLPAITPATSGGHTFNYDISSVVGGDFNTANNKANTNFYLVSGYIQSTVVAQSFSTTVFPPTSFGLTNADQGATWARHAVANGTTVTTGIGSAKMDIYNSPNGEIDELLLPPMSFTATATPMLTFDVAYAQYSNNNAGGSLTNDKLEVFVSDDCGANWTSVYSKSGSGLATRPWINSAFTPTVAGQWRAEQVALTGFNLDDVIVKFTATSNFGNNMYVDNINLSQVADPLNLVGITQVNKGDVSINVYPNPANAQANIAINTASAGKGSIRVVNTIGQVVYTQNISLESGANNIQLDVKGYADGLYHVVVETQKGSTVKKLTVSK